MINILLIDDSSAASRLAGSIIEYGYTVHSVSNLCDAEYSLLYEPGAENYDVILLDLGMRVTDLPKELQEEARRTYAGWAFYEYIVSKYPHLYSRTIIYTGYAQDFLSKIELEKRRYVYLLDKSAPNIVEKALNLLSEICKEK